MCGSGIAREGGVSASIDVGCAGLFAGKPRSYKGGVVLMQ
jgi:hypothetical protein